MIGQDQILDYVRKAKNGDDYAKEIVFKNNSPLIKSIIRRFKNKGVEYDDLFQIACIGLIKAIKNFDESFNVKFSTYAVPMVVGEIKRYMRDNGAIKVSRALKILANKISKYVDEYVTKNNKSPDIDNISKYFDVSGEEVVMALDCVRMPLSIFDKFDDEDESQELMNVIKSDFEEEKMIDKIQLSSIIDELSDREKRIVILRFYRDRTQSEVAKHLGVSQVQVSRLENKILEKIKRKF